MSERKVLNKYYPPDFDPSKIPRLHLPKDRQYTVRLMAPCNMKCTTCGEYIYKGKKFNARKETVQGEEYLGIKIFRFYIKCTRCLAEITFKTDPQNSDYIVELGATRNFQALKLAEEQAEREQREIEEEEASNPMKLLEKRTKASKFEMEMLESLEELRELNQRHAHVDFDKLLQQNGELAIKLKQKQEDDDEAFIKSVFGQNGDGTAVKRILDDDSDEDEVPVLKKGSALFLKDRASEILTEDISSKQAAVKSKQTISDGSGTSKGKVDLRALVKPKNSSNKTAPTVVKVDSSKKTAPTVVKVDSSNKTAPKSHAFSSSSSQSKIPDQKDSLIQTTANTSSALSLLGAYSDSDSSE